MIIKAFKEQKPQIKEVGEERFVQELFDNIILGLTMLDVNYLVHVIDRERTKPYIA